MYTLETTNAEKSKETKNAKHPSKKFGDSTINNKKKKIKKERKL